MVMVGSGARGGMAARAPMLVKAAVIVAAVILAIAALMVMFDMLGIPDILDIPIGPMLGIFGMLGIPMPIGRGKGNGKESGVGDGVGRGSWKMVFGRRLSGMGTPALAHMAAALALAISSNWSLSEKREVRGEPEGGVMQQQGTERLCRERQMARFSIQAVKTEEKSKKQIILKMKA